LVCNEKANSTRCIGKPIVTFKVNKCFSYFDLLNNLILKRVTPCNVYLNINRVSSDVKYGEYCNHKDNYFINGFFNLPQHDD
jgi:hypothetical protein